MEAVDGVSCEDQNKSVAVVDSKPSLQNTNGKDLCRICTVNASKYRCPKCLVRTCSLACVKAHKKSADCDGIRCKTAFVPMSSYNENHMLSDYRLLEEVARSCDNNERELKQKLSGISKWMGIWKNEASRRSITLNLAPKLFTMHKENSTRYDPRSKSFLWHIEWHFLPLDFKLQRKRVPDSRTIISTLKDSTKDASSEKPELLSYCNSADVAVFMRRRDYPANVEKYHSIDSNLNINEALTGKTIVEYPRFIVVLRSTAEDFMRKVHEEASPHASAFEPPERKYRNGRNFKQRKFGRGSHNGKPYQKKSPARHQQTAGTPNTPTISYQNHTSADTFP